MNQLLLHALMQDHRQDPQDSFVFLSVDAIPIKPFRYIYHDLVESHTSLFSIWEKNRRPYPECDGNNHTTNITLVKHSQWIVLKRPDAEKAVATWHSTNKNTKALMPRCYNLWTCWDELWH